ncbi:MAG TPA: hypothetical protein K8V30_03320 [Metalysinibacillus jejuensis]|uniref:Uncharacterized protein n=1 Tax=Metalysinibacillus jejuensis TaxID=914327 RepID=A0A921NAC9_9BACL|nr:hypothetical protein [Metalysinibacillus jejuensis]
MGEQRRNLLYFRTPLIYEWECQGKNKGNAEDIKEARAGNQRLANRLEAGQMLSAQDRMKFAIIDADKLKEHFTAKI